ncbi:GntR family transcriptional regulator [Micromonospora sp. WMMD737]|uniref:GntR family transcriptional regulator n=1 Tax=Micromonospora sp. WMMD737 TaxID=3404113 RepID=UPI003B92D79A
MKSRIESGAIPPGALLPAESTLTVEFRASRGTIRQAIAILRRMGMVSTEHGRGSYATPHYPTSASTHSTEPKARRRQVSADQVLAAHLSIEVGAPLIEEESVAYSNGQATAVIRVYYPQSQM